MEKNTSSVITLGTFDGVHLGHQLLIRKLKEEARKINAKPVTVTFFPHPSHILTPEKPLKLITSLDERLFLLRRYGIEHIHVEKFTIAFSKLSAEQYIEETLIGEYNMKILITGYDHGFGKDKEGDYHTLRKIGEARGFRVIRIAEMKDEKGITVSSTQIRKYLSQGKIEDANRMLGREFCLYGTVVRGNRLGRKIGFETANIVLNYPNKIVPAHGVYIIRGKVDHREVFGMMNIGNRPTVDGTSRTIEIHFLGIHKDLYDMPLRIFLLHKIREEMKFNSLDELKNQLIKDKLYAEKFIKNYGNG